MFSLHNLLIVLSLGAMWFFVLTLLSSKKTKHSKCFICDHYHDPERTEHMD